MIRTLLGPISGPLFSDFPNAWPDFPYPLFPNIREYLHDPAQLRLDLVGAEDRAVVVVKRKRVDPPAVVHLCMYTSISGLL